MSLDNAKQNKTKTSTKADSNRAEDTTPQKGRREEETSTSHATMQCPYCNKPISVLQTASLYAPALPVQPASWQPATLSRSHNFYAIPSRHNGLWDVSDEDCDNDSEERLPSYSESEWEADVEAHTD